MEQHSRRRILTAIASGEVGGGTTHVLRLFEGLDRNRFEPVLVCDPSGPLVSLARDLDVETHHAPFSRGRLSAGLWLELRRLLARLDVDLVHAHGSRAAFALTAALSSSRASAPLVYTEHGLSTNVPRGRLLTGLAARAERRVFRRASRILALSETSRDTIGRLAPEASTRIEIVPHGIDPHAHGDRDALRQFLDAGERIVVGTIARLTAPKAPADLVAAARMVAARRDDVLFVVVGDGPLRRPTEESARRLGLPFRFLGERSDARRWLDAMDIFCLPSRWESSPLSILEAMAARSAIVATEVGGIPSLIEHGVDGWLVPPARPTELAEALLALARDPEQRETLGARALERVLTERPLAGMLRTIERVYDELLEGRAMAGAECGHELRERQDREIESQVPLAVDPVTRI